MPHLLKSNAGVPEVARYGLYTQAQKGRCLVYVVHISMDGDLNSITKPSSLSQTEGPFSVLTSQWGPIRHNISSDDICDIDLWILFANKDLMLKAAVCSFLGKAHSLLEFLNFLNKL